MHNNDLKQAEVSNKQPDVPVEHQAITSQTQGYYWFRQILPVVFLLLVIVLVSKELGSLDIHALREVLQSLSLLQLIIIQVLALTGILVMGLYDWRAASMFNIPLSLPTLLRNAWIANTFNNLIGFSGLAGSGIRMMLLAREHIDNHRAAAFSALIMASVPVGLAVLSWPLLLSGGPGLDRLSIPSWTGWLALAVFAAYLPLYFLALYKGMFSRLLRGLVPQPVLTILGLIVISTLDWLIAATVIWVALDFSGADIPWPQFLSGFVLACTLGILSLIPGGLGVFDAALVLLLSPFAKGPEHIISGVLIYRVCYYLVPWLIAIYMSADKLMLPQFLKTNELFRQLHNSKLPRLLRLPIDLLTSLGIRVLGYLSFGAGVVLLVSAAFPGLSHRLVILHHYLPLAAIEISHVLSVATGVMLIALSRGITEQVRSAYYLTQILLLGGALLSLLKGIDYEEALILLTIAFLLRRQRSHFYRESYPLLSTRNLFWITGLITSVIAFAWLGDWVHGNIPLGWDALTRFEPALDAPRFSRALLTAATVVTIFIGWAFFSRPRFISDTPDAQALLETQTILNQYGGSEFSHLVFLGDKHLLWSADRKAFIQYAQIRDSLIALGDPCGSADAFDNVIIAFRDYADRYDLKPCFYEVSETHMHHYHDAGFALFKLGETAKVKLETFSLAGKRGESLRHSVNRAKREGGAFELLEQPLSDAIWLQLRTVSDAWLNECAAAEKSFSLGNYNENYLRLSPIGVIKVNEKIVAFANLMPDYGSHTELSIDLMRHIPDAPNGSMDFMFVELIQYAQQQGYAYFNLGMAPLGGVGESRYARIGEKAAHLAFKYGNHFYNYKGLRSFKEKYHPEWSSVYLAYPVFTAVPMLLIDSMALIAGGYRRIFFKSN